MITYGKARHERPISIIITTVAAQLYNNEDTIVDALASFLDGAEKYIDDHKIEGQYHVDNPSYPGENFADKWNKHPERAESFFRWLRQAKEDFDLSTLIKNDTVSMGNRIKRGMANNPELCNEGSCYARVDSVRSYLGTQYG